MNTRTIATACCLLLAQAGIAAAPVHHLTAPKVTKKTAKKQAVKPVKPKDIAKPSPGTTTAALVPGFEKVIPFLERSYGFSDQGDAARKHGDWAQAKLLYQQAQAVVPANSEALYGLGQCADHDGDLQTALDDYRANIYSHADGIYEAVPPGGYATSNSVRLLEFAILLSRSGLAEEAVAVYNQGIGFVNYEDGEPNTPLMYPTFGPTDAQARYSPELLQALAHVSIAVSKVGFDDPAAQAHARLAAQLAPNDAVVQFFVGECLSQSLWDADRRTLSPTEIAQNRAEAKVAYRKAAILGEGVVAAAIKHEGAVWALAP